MGIGLGKSKSKSKSQQTSSSINQAYPFLQETYAPQIAPTAGATSMMSQILGLSGNAAQNEGFRNFRENSGYKFMFDEGQDAVESNMSAKGLLRSGSALKALQARGQETASTYLDRYLQQLTGLSQTGINLGQLISGAGNKSDSQGTSKGSSFGMNLGIGK